MASFLRRQLIGSGSTSALVTQSRHSPPATPFAPLPGFRCLFYCRQPGHHLRRNDSAHSGENFIVGLHYVVLLSIATSMRGLWMSCVNIVFGTIVESILNWINKTYRTIIEKEISRQQNLQRGTITRNWKVKKREMHRTSSNAGCEYLSIWLIGNKEMAVSNFHVIRAYA